MKFSSLLLLCILLPQLVFASAHEDLKSLMDEFNYTMTVEWDQKDQDFANKAKAKLDQELSFIIEKGLSKEEILAVTGVDVGNIEHEVAALNINDTEAVTRFIQSHQSFKKGASWNGDIFGPVTGIVLATFITWLVISIVKRNNRFDECVKENNGDTSACIDNPKVLGR